MNGKGIKRTHMGWGVLIQPHPEDRDKNARAFLAGVYWFEHKYYANPPGYLAGMCTAVFATRREARVAMKGLGLPVWRRKVVRVEVDVWVVGE